MGAGLTLAVWLAESAVTGRDPLTLHSHSVAIWVVDALPIVFGLALSQGPLPRRGALSSGILPPPAREARPVAAGRPIRPPGAGAAPSGFATPSPSGRRPTPTATAREATPPPLPDRLTRVGEAPSGELAHIPEGEQRTVLVVDGGVEGPSVAAWLGARGYQVVHVGDVASGSLAREVEGPELAVVDGGAVGAQALIGELGRHRVPVIVLGGPTLSLPALAARTVRPPTARRLGEALVDLQRKGERDR